MESIGDWSSFEKALKEVQHHQPEEQQKPHSEMPALDLSILTRPPMKHRLQNTWTLWFFRQDRSQEWEENLKEVVNISTVEDFWALYNHIELGSRLPVGSDYCLFKAGIKPMWEDGANAAGGRCVMSF